MLLSRSLRAAVSLALLTPVTAADILTVGPAGSGAQFTQIQAAVNAASDDDVILVKPGNYQPIVVDKPLRILRVGDRGVFVGCQIRDIGTNEELVLSGLLTTLHLQNCSGTVVLHEVDVFDAGSSFTGVRIENCRRVLLLDSSIHSGMFGSNRGGAVSVQGSELWIANSFITGNNDCCFGVRASHAVELVSSTLHVWRSQIRGGNGNAKQGSGMLADGGTGIRAVGSTVNLFGGPTALVAGGPGSSEEAFGAINSPGGPGMDLAQNSRARIQRDLPVSGGLHGDGLVQAPAILVDATSSFTRDPKVFPTLVSSARQVQLGSTFSLTLTGNPGGYQVLFLSFRTGPTTILRGVDGFGLLDRPNMRRVATEILPASASHTLNLRVPNLASLLGATAIFQAAEQLGNSYAIGNPVLVTVTN